MVWDQADLLDDEEDMELMYLTRLKNAEISKSGPFRKGSVSNGSEDWHAREEVEELIEGYVQVSKGEE